MRGVVHPQGGGLSQSQHRASRGEIPAPHWGPSPNHSGTPALVRASLSSPLPCAHSGSPRLPKLGFRKSTRSWKEAVSASAASPVGSFGNPSPLARGARASRDRIAGRADLTRTVRRTERPA